MVTVWWSAAHLIHYSFPSETITSERYTPVNSDPVWREGEGQQNPLLEENHSLNSGQDAGNFPIEYLP